MQTKRRVATAMVVFSVAMGSGYFVQFGPTVQASVAHLDPMGKSSLGHKIANAFGTDETPSFPQIERTESGLPKDPFLPVDASDVDGVARRVVPVDPTITLPTSDHAYNAFGLVCVASLSVKETGASIATAEYQNPCVPRDRVELTYGGFEFTMTTNATGALSIDIPLLASAETLTATGSGGETQSVSVAPQGNTTIWRTALNWRGEDGLTVHAYEFGAHTHGPNHVTAGQSTTRSFGRILRLGDPSVSDAAIVEVYGHPLLGDVPSGTVEMVVAIDVTPQNCGRDVDATIWTSQGGSVSQQMDVSVGLPDCDAVGETLMLKNLIQDLKLATN